MTVGKNSTVFSVCLNRLVPVYLPSDPLSGKDGEVQTCCDNFPGAVILDIEIEKLMDLSLFFSFFFFEDDFLICRAAQALLVSGGWWVLCLAEEKLRCPSCISEVLNPRLCLGSRCSCGAS